MLMTLIFKLFFYTWTSAF